MTPAPQLPPQRSDMLSRLGVYLLGVAIGCLILGMLYMAKYTATQPTTPTPQPAPQPAPAPN